MVTAHSLTAEVNGWKERTHSDGTWQVWQGAYVAPLIVIESVRKPENLRRIWYIVERTDNSLYPPELAGPFPDLDAAKVAYLMLIAAKG